MPEINLTSRKTAPPKVISSHYYDESNKEYTAKFSEAYSEAGHDFTKSFKVLRLCYLFAFHILTHEDIFLYETLQLLCERGDPFTIERLAEELRMSKTSIRQCLDNLENAELLEIVKSDGQGQANYYILRTPLFERETVVGDTDGVIRRQNRILFNRVNGQLVPSGRDLPQIFIDDEWQRLLKQVKDNKARKMRDIARSKLLQKQNPQLWKEVKENLSNRSLTWHKIVKKLGNSRAATFDNIVFQLIQKLQNVQSTDYWNVFKARLKEYLERAKILFDTYLLDYGVELAAFYDSRRAESKQPATAPKTFQPAAVPPAAPETTGSDNEREETKEFLTNMMEAKTQDETISWLPKTVEQYISVFREARRHLTISEIQKIAEKAFKPDEWQLITVELRQ